MLLDRDELIKTMTWWILIRNLEHFPIALLNGNFWSRLI